MASNGQLKILMNFQMLPLSPVQKKLSTKDITFVVLCFGWGFKCFLFCQLFSSFLPHIFTNKECVPELQNNKIAPLKKCTAISEALVTSLYLVCLTNNFLSSVSEFPSLTFIRISFRISSEAQYPHPLL